MTDLAVLADVKLWLGIPTATTADDALLSKLITNVSADFLNQINRPSLVPSANYTETRNGNGTPTLATKQWPINSVASLTIDGINVPASPDGVQPGYVYDQSGNPESWNSISLVGGGGGFIVGTFGLQPSFGGMSIFTQGFNNVVITYNAGYATIPSEVNQAVIDWVAYRYRQRQWIGQVSKHMNTGETVTFQNVVMPATTKAVILQYRRKFPIL